MPELTRRREVGLGQPALVLDVTLTAVFHTVIAFSLYLHTAGHNGPGGGFIAGLVAGAALALRFVTGRPQLRSRAGVPSELILALGIILAAGMALTSLVLGNALMEHHTWKLTLPLIGDVKTTSAIVFDTGIYLIVVGVIATLLEVFGSEDSPVPAVASPSSQEAS